MGKLTTEHQKCCQRECAVLFSRMRLQWSWLHIQVRQKALASGVWLQEVWLCAQGDLSHLSDEPLWTSTDLGCVFTQVAPPLSPASRRSCVFPQLGLRVVCHIWWCSAYSAGRAYGIVESGPETACPLVTLLVVTTGMQKVPCFDVGNLGFSRLCKTPFIMCLRLNPFLSL